MLEHRMAQVTEHTSLALNCTSEFAFHRKYPPTINHAKEAAFCAQVLEGIVGAEHVDQTVQPSMGAEDFAFMLLEKPGCYVWIGNGQGGHRDQGHGRSEEHTSELQSLMRISYAVFCLKKKLPTQKPT